DMPDLPGRLEVARDAANSILPIAVFHGHEYVVKCAAFSPDGTRVVTGSRDGTARIWRVDSTAPPIVLPHDNGVWSAAFSPDNTPIVTGTGGAAANIGPTNEADAYLACIWRADGVGPPIRLRGHEGGITCVSFSPDATRVLTASEDGTAR